jgi:hypothetical protein
MPSIVLPAAQGAVDAPQMEGRGGSRLGQPQKAEYGDSM